MIEGLKVAGREGVSYARTNKVWQNRTGNLNDSFGFAIYYNGAQVFKEVDSNSATVPKMGKKGHDEAVKFLDSYDAGMGYTLIVVAGMYYAKPLEVNRKYDVLFGSFVNAKEHLEFKPINTNYYNE